MEDEKFLNIEITFARIGSSRSDRTFWSKESINRSGQYLRVIHFSMEAEFFNPSRNSATGMMSYSNVSLQYNSLASCSDPSGESTSICCTTNSERFESCFVVRIVIEVY